MGNGQYHAIDPSIDDVSAQHLRIKPQDLLKAQDISQINGTIEEASDDAVHEHFSQDIETRAEINHPRGEIALVLVELIAIVGKLLVYSIALWTHAWGSSYSLIPNAGIIVWSYVLILLMLRIYRTKAANATISNTWNQTAMLYGIQWACSVLVFRSAVIHPLNRKAQQLTIADFTLITVLFLIALGSRKGNKPVVLEYEGGLEPSREPMASLFSIATFSWVDAIVWHGYKKTYEMADVWNLAPKDKAAAILADYRRLKRTSRLVWHLLRYFKRGLLIQGAWAICDGFLTFLPTLLLKAILEYVENPDETPLNAAWFYVVLLACSSIAEGITNGQGLWRGRKVCIRLRAVVIGEIYAKALRRKAASATDRILGEEKERQDKATYNDSKKNKTVSFGRKKKAKPSREDPLPLKDTSDSQVNTGTIINLMAVDSFKLCDISAYLHFLWGSSPVQLLVCILLLYRILGMFSSVFLPLFYFLSLDLRGSVGACHKAICSAQAKQSDCKVWVSHFYTFVIRTVRAGLILLVGCFRQSPGSRSCSVRIRSHGVVSPPITQKGRLLIQSSTRLHLFCEYCHHGPGISSQLLDRAAILENSKSCHGCH